jgi:hypothetical protein
MGLNEGDKIASIAKIAKEDDTEAEADGDEATEPPVGETPSENAETGTTGTEAQGPGEANNSEGDSPPSIPE